MPAEEQVGQLTRFTDEESFGLFMEGLRALQLYEDETACEHPSKAMLERWMQAALSCLRHCVSTYSLDLLPKFYLGVTLTLKNQEIYVSRLIQLKDAYQALGRCLAFRDKKITDNVTAGAQRDFLDLRIAEEREQSASTELLSRQPWPLLEGAARLFGDLRISGGPELERIVTYNLAQVYARRGNEFLQAGLEVLGDRQPPAVTNFSVEYDPASWHDSLGPWREVERKQRQEKGQRQWCEAIALALQFDSLRESLHVRLQAASSKATFDQAFNSFEDVGRRMKDAELDLFFKADLLADHHSKGGYILYDRALRLDPAEPSLLARDFLETAAERLVCALELKEQWNPAQAYLATVRRLQSGMAEAEIEWSKWQCVQAVADKKPAFERIMQVKKREQDRRSAESDELFASLQGTTVPPPPPKFGDG